MTPFLSRHSWFDRSGQLGQGNYTTLGATYQLAKNFAVDAAYARRRADDTPRNIRWLEIHYTVER